ncbi:MAG: XRE family transcriptional regulator [Rhodospirillaceae bacterium]|nr:XRE family transcriptional regulator [Rhodospirillaceae bacterium]
MQIKPAKRKHRNRRLGSTVRRLRRNQGMTQVRLAEELGISAPYLNLIEHNQRSIPAELLVKFADLFGVELRDLLNSDDDRLLSDLMEAFGDVSFGEHDVTNIDLNDIAGAHPVVARAILSLYDEYRGVKSDLAALSEKRSLEGETKFVANSTLPSDAVSDFIQDNSNYFPSLEDAATRVRAEAGLSADPYRELIAYVERRFEGISVAILPAAARSIRHGTIRRFDPVSRTLAISELLSLKARKFQIAHQIGLMGASKEIEKLLDAGDLIEGETRALGRVALANYFAAALLMPYEEFLSAAQNVRYDVEMLEHRFDVSFEQVCHRLTTLHKPGQQGIPFHMLRVDIAGNTSKRFSASGLQIPRHGGACPRWNVYSAFMTPGRIHTQLGQWPDGSSYFCIARSVRKRGGRYGVSESYYSIGLGCDSRYAADLVYGDGLDLDDPAKAVPVGISCRTCERMDCRQRAFPPMNHRLDIDENSRGLSAYVTAR